MTEYKNVRPRNRQWHKRAICPECKWHCAAPFGNLFHVPVDCCPDCGCHKGTYRRVEDSWTIETMRFQVDRSLAVLWKPWTWGTVAGHWIDTDTIVEMANAEIANSQD